MNLTPTPKEIENIYRKNGGGKLAIHGLFHKGIQKDSSQLIQALQKRAVANKNVSSASRRTLIELKQDVVGLKL